MKKNYIAPSMEVEIFELDASIAANCGTVVSNGPEIPGTNYPACDDYYAITGEPRPSAYSRTLTHNVDFYDGVCDCYTTGSGSGFWMS